MPYNCFFEILSEYVVPFDKTLQILDEEVQRGKVGYFRKDSQANRVYYIHDKAITLTGEAGGGAAKMGQYLFGAIQNITKRDFEISVSKDGKIRPHRKDEKKSGISEVGSINRLNSKANTLIASNNQYIHTFENDYLFGCITPDRVEKRQNGQRFNDGRKFYTLTAQDQHGILIEGYIRKLTPVECERLQTLPDFYTEAVSKSQRYKMLGNGWTVDVIVEFFKKLNIIEL